MNMTPAKKKPMNKKLKTALYAILGVVLVIGLAVGLFLLFVNGLVDCGVQAAKDLGVGERLP